MKKKTPKHTRFQTYKPFFRSETELINIKIKYYYWYCYVLLIYVPLPSKFPLLISLDYRNYSVTSTTDIISSVGKHRSPWDPLLQKDPETPGKTHADFNGLWIGLLLKIRPFHSASYTWSLTRKQPNSANLFCLRTRSQGIANGHISRLLDGAVLWAAGKESVKNPIYSGNSTQDECCGCMRHIPYQCGSPQGCVYFTPSVAFFEIQEETVHGNLCLLFALSLLKGLLPWQSKFISLLC